MKNRKFNYLGKTLLLGLVLITNLNCERDLSDEAIDATFAKTAEIFIDDFNNIEQKGEEVYEQTSYMLDSKTIIEKYYFIFEWLQLFDFNILVILVIMIVVATINMVGGFVVTDRMLEMFKPKKAEKEEVSK